MRIFGIDPGSHRTGYGCVERIGSRHVLVICGSLSGPPRATFPDKLNAIHDGLKALIMRHRPDCVAVEDIFHARNVRSALKLGEARGVALLAASEAGVPVVSYAPAAIKRAVVGYGRAEKHQVQQMVKLLLNLEQPPTPHDVADALAVALCHLQSSTGAIPERLRAERRQTAIHAPVLARLSAVIALLRGSLIEKHPSRVVVDVGGVGYDVQVPLSTFYELGEPGATVVLRIHTHVREDLIALYGFSTPLEQDLFERLIAISGIGPKLGLAVLSGIEPVDLIRAIRTQDVARLTKIPGVGKKTAERIGLELKDRLPQVAVQAAEPAPGTGRPEDQLRDDLLSALVNLGYQAASAEKAIDRVIKASPDAGFEQALREALRSMMKGHDR